MQDQVLVAFPTSTQPSVTQTIIGKRASIDGIEEFRGIPYGKVPQRWQHAVLLDELPRSVFDATRNGQASYPLTCPRCPQPQEPNSSSFYQSYLEFPSDVTESEFDCLNLFITRPSRAALISAGIPPDTELPVYAYIHGGAYAFGAGTDPMWDPARLVAKSISVQTPIIVVTINYRLNMFGFAASSEIMNFQPLGHTRGCNFGLTDQNLALRWIKRHIRAFGGAADKVTVGGQSAGGSSAHAHILEAILESNPPLVQRGIIQSGAVGVLGPLSMEAADARWTALCDKLGAPAGDPVARMEFMRNVPPGEVLQAHEELGWVVCPLVEDGVTISRRAGDRWSIHMHTEKECNADIDACDRTEIAVLIGDTELEGTMHRSQVEQIKGFEGLKNILASGGLHQEDFWEKFCSTYNLNACMPVTSLHTQVFRFLSDIQFGYPVQRAREELMDWETAAVEQESASSGVRPVRVRSYRVDFGNPFPGVNHGLAHHCVDLIYLYDGFHDALRAIDGEVTSHIKLVDRMQTDWIAFIAGPSKNEPKGLATVYTSNRRAKVVKMSLDKDWLDWDCRCRFIGQNWIATLQAAKILAGDDHII